MIELDGVTKRYRGGVVALRDVTLNVDHGEFVFLVGPSGSGKTTLLRLLTHEETPTQGHVRVAGNDITNLRSSKVPALRRNIGCVFQDFHLLPNRTAAENIAFALEVTSHPRQTIRTRVPAILDLVGLHDKADRLPSELSGGEQQRVSIARAVVNHPAILLADEPTGNLDPTTSAGIMRLLERINRTGTTVIMATHAHTLVDTMRQRVIELDAGAVVRDQPHGAYDSPYGEASVRSSVKTADTRATSTENTTKPVATQNK